MYTVSEPLASPSEFSFQDLSLGNQLESLEQLHYYCVAQTKKFNPQMCTEISFTDSI